MKDRTGGRISVFGHPTCRSLILWQSEAMQRKNMICIYFALPLDLHSFIYFLVFVLSGYTFRFISSAAELLLSQGRMTEIKVSMLSILFLTA